jgi:hypothetical protein
MEKNKLEDILTSEEIKSIEEIMKLNSEEIKLVNKLYEMGYTIVKRKPAEYYGCIRCKETKSGMCCQCRDMLYNE